MPAGEILREYGTPIVAVYGVVQPWLISLWRRWARSPQIENHPTGFVEVGYSDFGPTVGVYGTFLAIHAAVFVENISVTLQRERDGAQHQFRWLAFRSNQLILSPPQPVVAELAAPFMVTPTQPHRYNILLSDAAHREQMIQPMVAISEAWATAFRGGLAQGQVPNPAQLFEGLVRGGTVTDHWSALQRFCYWEAGNYSIEIAVQTRHPQRVFRMRRAFTLLEDDAERLRRNALSIFANLCGQSNVIYNFAYPSLRP